MKLTPHFDSIEFACKDGTLVPDRLMPNLQRLAAALEVVRVSLSKPVIVISGYRSPAHNARVKGAKSSRHMTAEAADVRVAGLSAPQLFDVFESLIASKRIPQGGLGLYPTSSRRKLGWVHFDVRGTKARWKG